MVLNIQDYLELVALKYGKLIFARDNKKGVKLNFCHQGRKYCIQGSVRSEAIFTNIALA
jgi:hypothetical protein